MATTLCLKEKKKKITDGLLYIIFTVGIAQQGKPWQKVTRQRRVVNNHTFNRNIVNIF